MSQPESPSGSRPESPSGSRPESPSESPSESQPGPRPDARPERDRSFADRRENPEEYEQADFAGEFAPSVTDPAEQPADEASRRVYGEAEGYEKPTEA